MKWDAALRSFPKNKCKDIHSRVVTLSLATVGTTSIRKYSNSCKCREFKIQNLKKFKNLAPVLISQISETVTRRLTGIRTFSNTCRAYCMFGFKSRIKHAIAYAQYGNHLEEKIKKRRRVRTKRKYPYINDFYDALNIFPTRIDRLVCQQSSAVDSSNDQATKNVMEDMSGKPNFSPMSFLTRTSPPNSTGMSSSESALKGITYLYVTLPHSFCKFPFF